jgi:hypothetical protein
LVIKQERTEADLKKANAEIGSLENSQKDEQRKDKDGDVQMKAWEGRIKARRGGQAA